MKRRIKGFFLLACPLAIILIYLYCECFHDLKDVLYYIYPAAARGMMILFVYLAWKSYTKEKSCVIVSILLSGIAVIVSFAESCWSGWFDWLGVMFAFACFLWPVLITCLSNYCGRKATKNKKYIFGVNFFIVLILSVLLFWFAESAAGKFSYVDLCLPVIWLAESILWTFVLNCETPNGQRKRYLMAAWLVCLAVFGGFSYVNVFDLRNEWNGVIILCWPMLIFFLMKQSNRLIAEDKPHFILKRCLFCFFIVLLLVYVTANTGLNYGRESLKYDIGRVFYCLFLTDIMLWDRGRVKWKEAGCRIKTMAFMAAINVGVLIYLLIANERLQNILSGIAGIFSGSVRAASQVDWLGYRKAVFRAFFLNDLTELDNKYRREYYTYSVDGNGLTSIRFHFGMLPLLAMVLLLILLVIILWKWNHKNITLNQCARYFAFGYLIKMFIACISQAGMFVSPYMDFPFTRWDIAEIILPILLFWESFCVRRYKD